MYMLCICALLVAIALNYSFLSLAEWKRRHNIWLTDLAFMQKGLCLQRHPFVFPVYKSAEREGGCY